MIFLGKSLRFAEQYHAREEEEAAANAGENGLLAKEDPVRANVFDVTGDKLAMDLSDLKKESGNRKGGTKLPSKCGYHRPTLSANEFQQSNPPWALRIIGEKIVSFTARTFFGSIHIS